MNSNRAFIKLLRPAARKPWTVTCEHIKKRIWKTSILALLIGLLTACGLDTQFSEYEDVPRYFNIPYVSTPPEVVTAMLELADAKPGDIVYDLGSGDGRIPISAVLDFDADKAVGIEINPDLVSKAKSNASKAGVSDRVKFKTGDIYAENYSEATIVTLYLAEDANKVLLQRLKAQLALGARIVSHQFKMGDWEPEKTLRVGDRSVYLWVIKNEPTDRLMSFCQYRLRCS